MGGHGRGLWRRYRPGDDRLPPTQPFVGELDPVTQDPKVIYVNMDGAELTQGQDNSLENRSAICGGSFPSYGQGQKREATLQAVYADWDAYNVIITTDRPTEGNFTMAVVSPVPQSVWSGELGRGLRCRPDGLRRPTEQHRVRVPRGK